MKKIFYHFLVLTISLTLGSCVSDDLADVGDLQDFTGPTPFFTFSDITAAEFDCADVEISVDYNVLFTAGSNLAVNGTNYAWSVEPAEGITLINSRSLIIERQIEAQLATVLDIEEDIAALETRIPCEEDPARVAIFEAQIADLQVALETANAEITEETRQNVADLESQLAALPAGTLEDQEIVFNFPSPGDYMVSLVVTDNLGKSDATLSQVRVNQAVPTIPVPEIGEPGFEDGSLFDGTGDGRDSWRTPSGAAADWSPFGGTTTVPQINGNSELGRVPEGLQAAKMPADGTRVLYQEIDAVSYTHLTLPTTPYV